MKDSNIAWCHATFNPFRGCSGERCQLHALGLCYAEARETRLKRDFLKVIPTRPEYWQQPWGWEKEGEATGTAKRVFCGSWMDINDRQADAWRSELWPIVKATPHVTYMMLTKIPERYPKTLPDDWGEGYENVWLGASVLHVEDFRRNAKSLREVKAKLRFLSMEPLFGPVTNPDFTGISQVIVGGLSGPKWEEHVMDMAWAVDLYHPAQKQGVSYFFKQVSAREDEQWIDAIGKAPDGVPRIIREVPDAAYPWSPMRIKSDKLKAADLEGKGN